MPRPASRETFAHLSFVLSSRSRHRVVRTAKRSDRRAVAPWLRLAHSGRQFRAWAAGVSLLALLLCLSPHSYSQSCSTSCTGLCLQQINPATSVSGTVYAPNGTTPLPNVLVYVPNGGPAPAYGVTPFPAGVSCGVSASGCPLVSTVSATNGTFTLTNMPVGSDIPLVIQAGKWRRKISIPAVTAGTNTALTAAQTSLPSTEGEYDPADNIPYVAVVTGAVDAAECVLLKMGVAQTEFTNPPASPAPNGGRINLYLGAAESGAGEEINSSTPGEASLFASQASVDAYDLLMFPCQGAPSDTVAESTINQGYLGNYANAGGHIYATHYSYQWLDTNTAFPGTVTWDVGQAEPVNQTGYINTGFPQGEQLAQWLKDVGASTTLGQIPLSNLRHDQSGVLGSTQSWLTINDPSEVVQLTFNTPVAAAPANQCGQVLFNEYHVFEENGDTGVVFPAACSAGALTAQEELLAYSVFGLSTSGSAEPAPSLTVAVTNSPAAFVQGDFADTITINVTNTSTTSPTNPTLQLVAVLPAGLTVVSMVGSTPNTGWTCNPGALTCTRTTGLSASTSDAIILTVSVSTAETAGSHATVSATASGGGIASNATGTDNILILGQTAVALTVSPSAEDWSNDAPVTITAQLTWLGSGPAPQGGVAFGSSSLSGIFSGTICGPEGGDTLGCAITYFPTTADMPGSYELTATYGGDSNYEGSSGTGSFTVNLATTTTTVASSANPSFLGSPVTFTATIGGEFGLVKGRQGSTAGNSNSNPSNSNPRSAVSKGASTKGGLTQNGLARAEVTKNGALSKEGPQLIGGGSAMMTWSANTGCGQTPVASGYPGTATCTTSSLGVGNDPITATYSGDADHGGSTGTLLGGEQVNPTTTSIAVTSVSPSTEIYGQDALVTITAVLSWSGTGPAPTASDVSIGGYGFSGSFTATSCATPVGTTVTCSSTYTPTPADNVGSYTIWVYFAGDSNYTSSFSALTDNFSISQATSSVSVATSGSPSVYGQPVTFVATIGGQYAQVKGRNGAASKRGAKPENVGGGSATVIWSANTGCSPSPVASGYPGTASCTTSSLPEGSDAITATYSGDNDHSGSSGTLSGGQQVNQATAVIVMGAISPNPEAYGQDAVVTLNATVEWSGSGVAPTGAVTFGSVGFDGGPPLSGSFGAASCAPPSGNAIHCTGTYTPTPSDVVGDYTMTAAIAGDSNYQGSNSIGQPGNIFGILPATSSVTVGTSGSPSIYGQPVTFTATIGGEYGQVKGRSGAASRKGIKPQNVGGAGATVTWSANTGCSPSTVAAGYPGTASCTTSSLPEGGDTITATYSGDSNHGASTGTLTPVQQVNQAATDITAGNISPNPEIYGQDAPVAITATLSWGGVGAVPTGAVTFGSVGFDGGPALSGSFVTNSCSAPSANAIQCTGSYTPTPSDVADYYIITAAYAGDNNYQASTNALQLPQPIFGIVKATSTVAVATSGSPSIYGQPVTFTATIGGEYGQVKGRSGVTSRKGIKPQNVGGAGATVTWSANTGCSPSTVAAGYPGTASCTTSSLPEGGDTITATYSGDSNHGASTGTLTPVQQVTQAATTIAVTSVSPATEIYGQDAPVTITAVLSWSGSGVAPTASDVSIGGSGFSGTFAATSCALPVGTTVTCTSSYTPTPSDNVGNYTISATFTGDGNYTGSSSAQTGNFSISAATSSVSVATSGSPSVYGQAVTFTATIGGQYGQVKRGGGAASLKGVKPQVVGGSVTWSGNTTCGTTPVTAGMATCTTSSLPEGSDAITVTYLGDGNHGASSGTLTPPQQVNQAATTIAVTSVSPSTLGYGQDAPVTITAVLSWLGGGAAPTASAVSIGGSGFNGSFGTTSCTSPSSNTNTMTCSNTYKPTPADGVGSYTFSAKFAGDGNYTTSSSAQTNNFTITQASTGVAVASNHNPSVYGQPVTFTATIGGEYGQVVGPKGVASGKGVQPQIVSGSVTWSSNTGCGTTTVTAGPPATASCTTSILPVGTDGITATYLGDGNHGGSTGTLANGQVVQPASTSTALISSLNPSVYGQSVSFTAQVAAVAPGAGVPTGTVQFAIDGTNFGSPVSLSAGSATSGAITTLTEGTHTVTASYLGSTNFATSNGTLSGGQTVNSATSSVTVTSGLNPTVFGQAVTFTATIAGEYGLVVGRDGAVTKKGAQPQIVTGSVTWSINTGCGTTTVTAGTPGTASCTTSILPVGTDAITATYLGDGNHGGNTGTLPGGQVVHQASTTTTLASSLNPSVYGQSVSFTANVAVLAPGTGTPTGTIQFAVDGTNFGSPVALSAGSATSGTTSTLTAGKHTITATYSGSTSFVTSAAASLSQVVNLAPAITSASSATFTLGVASSFTVTTTGYPTPSLAETGALPAGVSFINNGNGTGTLSGTPTAGGTFKITFTASNGIGSNAVQSFTLTTSGPLLTVTPASYSFGTVYLFSRGNTTITLKNTGTSTVTINKVSLTLGSGTNPGDFTFTSFCLLPLASGQSCNISVGFFAGNVGAVSATLSIADNSPGSPQQIVLSANVINPVPNLSPAVLNFGTIKVGSHSSAQTVTLTNVGTTALNLTSIGVTGTNASDFAETNTCPASLAPGAKCTISVIFTPGAKGARSANLTVVDNALIGTQNVTLCGTGD